MRWIVVSNHRMCRRAAACLANTDTDAGERQVNKIGRESGDGRHRAPERNCARDKIAAIAVLGIACDRDTQSYVEQGEHSAGQNPERRIADVEFRLDGRQQDRQDLPINKIEHVDDRQDDDGISTGTPGNRLSGRINQAVGLGQYRLEQEKEYDGQDRASRDRNHPGRKNSHDDTEVDRVDTARHSNAKHRADQRVSR